MRAIVREAEVDNEDLARILTPRRGLVLESEIDHDGEFGLIEGPFHAYRRSVTVTSGTTAGRSHVRQIVEAELAIPYWGWLFRAPYRGALGRIDPATSDRAPWWAPPDRLDAEASVTLAALAVLSAVLGYATILLSQTVTFAAHEFGVSKAAQGVALAAVRFDVLLAFPLVALTDRRGRRRLLLLSAAVASVITAFGALAPSLPFLIATQVPARGMLQASLVIVTIMTAEEMPAGARAYAIGLLSMAGAIGSGICILLLPLADISDGGWRALFALAVLGLIPLASVRKHLVESKRFRAPHPDVDLSGHGSRLWLLAVSAFLLAVFFTPATQFINEFLRDERGFTAARISLFTVLTNIPGGIGIVVGGRLADTHGRRGVGAFALFVGVGATVAMYLVTGWPLWAWSTVGSVIGAATVPALGVYGPELFPTALRGRANAILGFVGRLGSVAGLIAVGVISTHHTFGPAIGLVAIGPALLAILIVVAYPETAHRTHDDINPEDKNAGETEEPGA